MIQEILEKEVLDALGRKSDERRKEGQEGYRNGYQRKRLKSGEGMIEPIRPSPRLWPRESSNVMRACILRRSIVFKKILTSVCSICSFPSAITS